MSLTRWPDAQLAKTASGRIRGTYSRAIYLLIEPECFNGGPILWKRLSVLSRSLRSHPSKWRRRCACPPEAADRGCPLSDLPSDLRELYTRVGIACEIAQVVEVEAGNLALAYLTLFVKPGREVTPAETEVFRAVIEDINHKTLGAMFRHLRGVASIDPALLAILDKALEKRNYLTHHFFRTHNFAINSVAGRKTMIEDLESVTAELRLGHQVLSAMTDSVNHLVGHENNLRVVAEKFVNNGKPIDI